MDMIYASTLLVLIVAIGVISLAVAVLTRLASYRAGATSPAAASSFAAHGSSSYDASHYAPMVHVLDSSEIEFLKSQDGITAAEIAKFQQDRRLVFREYLIELTGDFQRLHAQARVLVATAPAEHSDLVGRLFSQQITFWKTICVIECQLALEGFGVRAINPQRLVDLVSSLDLAVGQTVPGPMLA